MDSKIISAENCISFTKMIMEKVGVSSDVALRWAELMVQTSLLGFDSHGIRMLERYVDHIEGGGIDPSVVAKIVSKQGQGICMDAKFGLGHIAADDAASIAIEKAKKHGISCVAVRNANHTGACGLYVRKAALADCIGIFTTVSRATMAPWGGITPFLGSNPIAVAAPIEGKHPFLYDAASTVVSMGKITAANDSKEKIPDNWALDSKGKPTTNSADAIKGTLLPMAGHKGYGLAMAVEILSSFLSGGLPSFQVESWVQQAQRPTNASFTIIVIDIGSFGKVADFKKHMKIWVELLTTSALRDGFKRIYYPGEMEAENYQYRSKHGISLCFRDWEMLERLAGKFGIDKLEFRSVG